MDTLLAMFAPDADGRESPTPIIDYANDLKKQRAAAEQQLTRLKAGLKVSFDGVDRTGSHFVLLRKMVKSYDRLLETLDAGGDVELRPGAKAPCYVGDG